jgi:hypothetical protein
MRLINSIRRVYYSFVQRRTVTLLDQLEADVEEMFWQRDSGIPMAIRQLAIEKHELLLQLESVTKKLGDQPMQPTTEIGQTQ